MARILLTESSLETFYRRRTTFSRPSLPPLGSICHPFAPIYSLADFNSELVARLTMSSAWPIRDYPLIEARAS